MRLMHIGGLLAACALATDAAAAGAGAHDALIGAWRVTSTRVHTVGVEGEKVQDRVGYLIFTPEHRVVALVADPGRKPAANDTEALTLARSLVAYTGKFDLAPDHITIHLEFSSTQINIDHPQVRYYKIDGDKLTITTPTHDSLTVAGRQNWTILSAVRDR